MIHIWNQKNPWPTKVNFIQESPLVILGYDMEQDCCEDYSWRVEGATLDDEGNLPWHTFDTAREPEELLMEPADYDRDDRSYAIRFFLKGQREGYFDYEKQVWSYRQHPDASIVLTCCHNGYYSHGWELLTVTKEGRL